MAFRPVVSVLVKFMELMGMVDTLNPWYRPPNVHAGHLQDKAAGVGLPQGPSREWPEEGTMARRLGISAAVIAVMALMVGAVSPALGSSSGGAASASSGHADGRTIRVILVPTEAAEIDLGAPGFSLGDTVVFGGVLQRPDGTPVGRYGLVCTFVSAANPAHVEAQCPTTATLPGGQITTQGIVVNRALNTTLPITGGSGRFQGAGGQMVQRDISSGGHLKLELTFHLKF